MLRLSSTRYLAAPVLFRPAVRAATFHSTRYSLLVESTETSRDSRSTSPNAPPPNLTPAARRRLQPDPEFSSSSSSSPSPPIPQPISPPPDQVPSSSTATTRQRRVITSVNELPPSFGRNQIIKVPEEVENDLQDVLKAFKKSPIRFAFAYGSGVFRQKGYTAEVST